MAAKSFKSKFVFDGFNFPVKVSKATEDEDSIKFKTLNSVTNNPVSQDLRDSKTGEPVPYPQTIKGYEYERDKFVLMSKEDLDSLACESTDINISEFVSRDDFDPTYINESYYIKPDQLGAHGYLLFAEQLETTNTIAIGYWGFYSKERLVAIRPYKQGLLMHTLYYRDQVRDFENNIPEQKIDYQEKRAMQSAIKRRTVTFNMAKYNDVYANRLLTSINNKIEVARTNNKQEVLSALKAIKSN